MQLPEKISSIFRVSKKRRTPYAYNGDAPLCDLCDLCVHQVVFRTPEKVVWRVVERRGRGGGSRLRPDGIRQKLHAGDGKQAINLPCYAFPLVSRSLLLSQEPQLHLFAAK